MSQYCVYFLDDGGRVTGLSAALFDTDDAAGRWASDIAEGRSIELWSPDRKVEVGSLAAQIQLDLSVQAWRGANA